MEVLILAKPYKRESVGAHDRQKKEFTSNLIERWDAYLKIRDI